MAGLGIAGLGITMLGCASSATTSSGSERGTPGSDATTAAPNAEVPSQWLFRAEISGEEGSGSLRLRLRRFAAERFSLTAADALGQARWEIRGDGEAAIWLDSQTHVFCRLDSRQPLRASQWLPNIPLMHVPDLLTGEWPAESAVAKGVSPEPTAQPQFTGERGEGFWTSWTLWEGGEPVAWFQRRGPESLLSVRRPSVQVRWRVTAHGDLDLPAADPARASSGAAFLLPGDLVPAAREIACPENALL